MEADNNAMGGGEDLYSDGPAAAAPPEKDAAPDDKGKDDGRDTQEAILPRSICPHMDMAVGDKLEFEVTAIHDKEISVKYSSPDEDEGKDKGGDKAPMPAGMASGGNDMYD